LVSNPPLRHKKVLVTCGPTWVPIDDMRILSNRSTGEMGYTIAEKFRKAGAKVTVLEGPITHTIKTRPFETKRFFFYNDLFALLKTELKKKYDVVIHAAAVSDFQMERPYRSKLDSDVPKIKLNFVPTKKIVDKIKRLNPSVFLVGFKLESVLDPKEIARKTDRLFAKAGCDLVVANSFRGDRYRGFLIDGQRKILARSRSRNEMAQQLVKTVKEKFAR
jgi:phosphopantothenoylcysteine decarboxylase/phosphopantothenate--cysteine ligase